MRGECADALRCIHAHRGSVIDTAFIAEQMDVIVVTFQPQTLARDTEAQLEFRADRHEFDKVAQCFKEESVTLMAAVEADFCAE